MEGGNLKYIPKIFSIQQRQSLDSTSLSRLSFANPKEENAESRTAAEERSSSSKTVLPLSLSRPRTPPPQGFLPPRVESRLDFLGKVERVPLWAVHLVATSPDQPATLVRRNWHQGQRWFLSPSLFRRLLLRPVPFEIMLSV